MSAVAGFVSAMRRLPQRLLIGLIRFYRYFLSPWLGARCPYEPTCSAYALEALQRHGAAAGSLLAGGRLLRCHPWCLGGPDPVPGQPPRLFSRLLARHPQEHNTSTSP